MKPLPLPLILALALSSCVTMPDGSRRLDMVAVNSIAALAVDIAAQQLGVPPDNARAIKAGFNALSGIAAQSQANLGATPKKANVAQGSHIPAVGAAVQAALPNRPLDQKTVDALFAAAEKAKTITK